MLSRKARQSLVTFLLIVGVAGAYVGFDTYQRRARAFAAERTILSRLDTMLASVNELAVTQRGYFEPTRGNGASNAQFERVRELTEQLKEHLPSLQSQITSPEGIEQVTALASALDDFATTDSRVRTNLANDTFFSAADLVFSASATELRAATTALIALKELTSRATATEYESLERRTALAAGVVGLVWTIGLLLLTPLGRQSEPATVAAVLPTPAPEPAAQPELPASAAESAAETLDRSADLAATADICAAMARVNSATELREILADAAGAVGATGLIVWLGAGEELFPVLGHGYDPRMLARLGPLPRNAENATTTAWREVQTKVVTGEPGRAGAIVVPLVGSQGCIGVLSAEVPSGDETDPTTRAVTTLFAAQLSTIVAAWPEPSSRASEGTMVTPESIAVRL